jgi:hypothetical protein
MSVKYISSYNVSGNCPETATAEWPYLKIIPKESLEQTDTEPFILLQTNWVQMQFVEYEVSPFNPEQTVLILSFFAIAVIISQVPIQDVIYTRTTKPSSNGIEHNINTPDIDKTVNISMFGLEFVLRRTLIVLGKLPHQL